MTVACETSSREPAYLLEGGMAGDWQIDHHNAHGGAIPDGFDSFTLRLAPGFHDQGSGDWLRGTLVDAVGCEHRFDLLMGRDLGPCLLLAGESGGDGGAKHLRVMPMIDGNRENDMLLVAFEKASDGAAYPHEYERQ